MTAVVAGVLVLGANPAPAAAATADDMEARILASMNADRVAQGLVSYRRWTALDDLAAERAARMATLGQLSHEAAGGSVGDALDARSIDWLGFGEAIALSSYPWGDAAADHIFDMWKGSPPHLAIMRSAEYNYVGIAVVQGADGRAWASAIMTESVDHTAPTARIRSLTRRGDDLTLTWSGSDPRLQTHTAGLRSFDVQMKRDSGSWRTVRDNTTGTRAVFRDRRHGHWFTFRVQAADWRGTLSTWTSEIRIRVP
jgi:uncharacterized protein YkwD